MTAFGMDAPGALALAVDIKLSSTEGGKLISVHDDLDTHCSRYVDGCRAHSALGALDIVADS